MICFQNVIFSPFFFLSSFPHLWCSQSGVFEDLPIRSRRVLSAYSAGMQKGRLSGKIKDTEPARSRARAWRSYHPGFCMPHYYTASPKPVLRLKFLQLLLSPLKILMDQESRSPTRILKYLTMVEAHSVGRIIKLHCPWTKQD